MALIKVQDLFTYETTKIMHQFTLDKLPDRFKHYFTHSSNLNTYSTRNSSNYNLFLPRHSITKTQNTNWYKVYWT